METAMGTVTVMDTLTERANKDVVDQTRQD